VGAGRIKALQLNAGRAPMTMAEILGTLAAKARVEAEDAQRLLLSALNGLAAVMLLQGNPTSAVQTYREVGCLPTFSV
jgi:E3 ubiquitin-protein ligase SHPRH